MVFEIFFIRNFQWFLKTIYQKFSMVSENYSDDTVVVFRPVPPHQSPCCCDLGVPSRENEKLLLAQNTFNTLMSSEVRLIRRLEILEQLHEPHLGVLVLDVRRKRVVLELVGEAEPEGVAGARVVRQTQVAPDDVFEEPGRRRLGERQHHLAEYHGDVREPLVRLADVRQPGVVEEDFLEEHKTRESVNKEEWTRENM